MQEIKNTARATVRIGFDGRVHNGSAGQHGGTLEHEVRVLKYLESRGCTLVPQLLEVDPESMRIVTTNCGGRVGTSSSPNDRRRFLPSSKASACDTRIVNCETSPIAFPTGGSVSLISSSRPSSTTAPDTPFR